MMAAAALDGAIGKDNALPWKLPADMKRFRLHTTGKPIVMGRKTFASLGDRPLPNRLNIVLSRSLQPRDGVVVVASLDDAFAAAVAAREDVTEDVAEVVIIGGAAVYAQALPRAHRLLLTLVDVVVAGADAYFPDIGPGWRCDPRTSLFDIGADDKNAHRTSYVDLWRSDVAPPGCEPFSWHRATGVVHRG